MRPRLVIGLGNPLMGDDGVGCRAAERLAADPRLPANVDVVCGGTDLLRHADEIEGREAVLLIDAVECGAEPGMVSEIVDGAAVRQTAHRLSLLEQIALLRLITRSPIRLLGISVHSARAEPALSPAITARIPAILDRILEELP